jgi:hypothetical protein
MYAAFPRSEYYAGSAPSRTFGGRRAYPPTSLARTRPGSSTRWFPRSLLTVRERRCPAMPLRHRSGYAVDLHQSLPAKRDNRPKSSPPGNARQVRTATQPISARFELVEALKGFTPLVPHVHLSRSLTRPAPSGSTGTSRRCRGCSHPHPRLRDQAASNFKRPATTGHRRRHSTSARSNSASWRTPRPLPISAADRASVRSALWGRRRAGRTFAATRRGYAVRSRVTWAAGRWHTARALTPYAACRAFRAPLPSLLASSSPRGTRSRPC